MSDRNDTDRLEDVAAILGLLPSRSTWDGRAMYLAFLIASGSSEDAIAEAREAVEALRPGWLDRVRRFRKEAAGHA